MSGRSHEPTRARERRIEQLPSSTVDIGIGVRTVLVVSIQRRLDAPGSRGLKCTRVDAIDRDTGGYVRAQVSDEVGGDLDRHVPKAIDQAFKKFPVKEPRTKASCVGQAGAGGGPRFSVSVLLVC